jgi:hypothetical protein
MILYRAAINDLVSIAKPQKSMRPDEQAEV